MQISYHFALTKIQKLQNLKNNNNKFFFSIPAGMPGTGQYFFRYKTGGLIVSVCLSVRYIPAIPVRYIPASTVWY